MISKIRNSFKMVGKLKKSKDHELVSNDKPKWAGKTLKTTIVCGEDGMHFIKFFGGDNKKGKAFENKKIKNGDNEFEVSYDERFDPEILSQIGRGYKKTVVLDGQTNEFIYQNDFIDFVFKNFEKLEGKVVEVTGEINASYSTKNKKVYIEYVVNNVKEAADDVKQCARGTIQLFYPPYAIDEEILKNGKVDVPYLNEIGNKVKIKAFLESRNQSRNVLDVESLFFPVDAVIDLSKIDFTNDNQSRKAHLLVKNVDNRTENVLTSCWEVKLINAQEKKSYTQEEINELLTPEEREYAELWGEDIEEVLAKKQGTAFYGERVNEIRCFKPESHMPIKIVAEDVSTDMLDLYKAIGANNEDDNNNNKKQAKKVEEENNAKNDIDEDEFENLF